MSVYYQSFKYIAVSDL